jgi:periplasmic protein TorT
MKARLSVVVIVALLGAAALFRFHPWHSHAVRAQPDPRAGIRVESYYGRYDPATSAGATLRGPIQELWRWNVSPAKGRSYRIGVLFPNREQNDIYWKAVRLGVQQEAAAAHVSVEIVSSDDYTRVDQHQKQFEALARSGVDAIVLGAIHYRAMDTLVQRATAGDFGKKIPVIAVVNDIYAPAITAKVLVSFFDMGRIAGRVVEDAARQSKNSDLTIAFFPGPINSGWAPDSLRGFLSVIRDYPGELHIISPKWGTPDQQTQSNLVESVVEKNQSLDYIVGNAVAAAAAVRILNASGRDNDVHVVSTYYSESVDPLIRAGKIEAAPWDHSDALGRIAIGMAVRVLNGERPGIDLPFRVGPTIDVKRPMSATRASFESQ